MRENMTATPMTPPTPRRNWIVDVETPITLYGTTFWTASMKSGIDAPRPMPNTTIAMRASIMVALTSIRESIYMPATMTRMPVTPRMRYLPKRDMSCPETALAMAMAIIMGMVTNPELVADEPMTPWTKRGM